MNSGYVMLEYIKETRSVLKNIISNRKEYFVPTVNMLMSKDIDRVEMIGSGTSSNAEASVCGFFEDVLKKQTNYSFPYPFMFNKKSIGENVLVIAVSQSGESTSTVKAVNYAKEKHCTVMSFTETSDDTLSDISDIKLSLHCGEENIGAKTKGYQASMLCLELFCLEYGLALKTITEQEYRDYLFRIQKTVDNLDAIVNSSVDWYHLNKEKFVKARRIIVLGYDANYGNVLEGKLKLEETVRFGIEGYEQEEFMHGIYNAVDKDTYIFYLAQKSPNKQKVSKLIQILSPYTDNQFVIGNGFDFEFGFTDDEYFSVYEYIIPLQCLSFFLSDDLNIDISKPKIENFHHRIGSK